MTVDTTAERYAPDAGRASRAANACGTATEVCPSATQRRTTCLVVGGGISGDGLHGYTFGTMTVTRADGGKAPAKYLAYWVKGAKG